MTRNNSSSVASEVDGWVHNIHPHIGAHRSPVHDEVPQEEERVEEQKTRDDLHEEPPAGRSQLRQRGAPQRLEERGGGEHRAQVSVQHPPETVPPLLHGGRRTRARGDPPQLDPLTDAGQRVQREEGRAEEDVRQESEAHGQVGRLQERLVLLSHVLPQPLEDSRVRPSAHHGPHHFTTTAHIISCQKKSAAVLPFYAEFLALHVSTKT